MQAVKTTNATVAARVTLMRAALIIRHAVRVMTARGNDFLLAAQLRAAQMLQGIGMTFNAAAVAVAVETRAARAACC